MEQAGFDAYTGTADAEDRPDEEASAIAGEASDTPRTDVEESALPAADGRLEIAVTQIDYTVTTVGGEERPLIHVFGRTAEDTPEHVRVHGFRPYFYVPAASVDVSTLEELDGITGWDRTDEAGEPFESIRGESLLKVYGRTPRDVGEVRDRFDHYEADILFPNRFLIDKGITSGLRVPERRADDGVVDVSHEAVEPVEASATLRVNTFDIEVDDRSGFPEDGEEEILCVASHDSYRDEYVSWLYRPPDGVGEVPTTLADHDLLDGDGAVEVRAFDSEEAMLEAFIEYLRETDPDLLNGWNFADFDAPYLIDRLKRLDAGSSHDLDYNRLSRVDEVWESDWQGPNIKGRIVFDLLYAYQRTQFSELDSYRLDAVAEQELGVGKERYAGAIGDLWETDPERLLEYNVRDVELCIEIDRKQGIIPFWEEVASFVGCKLEDATTPGDAVDMYVLHKAHGKFALPSKGQQEGEDFEGGAVFDPITGVREMVSVLDLACFSGDTELMTPEGVRQITDIGVGDEVYTLNPQTFECEVKQVTDTHTYENTYGRLHHLSGTTHDLKVTENHRFLISKKRGWNGLTSDDFEFSEYRDIPRTERFAFPIHEPMAGSTPETFSLVDEVDRGSVVVYSEADLRRFRNRMPDTVTGHLELMHGSSAVMGLQKKVGKYLIPVQVYRDHRGVIDRHADDVYLKYAAQHRETPLSFDMEDWLEFLGWYVTEGSLNSAASSVTLHQSNGDGRYTIRSLLDRMGLNYSVSEDRFTLSNRLLHDWLESNCGKGYANKRLPEWVFELDASLLETLVETMIEGDGEWSKEGFGKFWTKSDGLKQDIARCAVRCGHKPTVTKQQDGTWYVSIGKWGSFNKSVNETVEDHDGKVHCVTAEDNHVVLAGRNGHFQWVGQSLYPMAMVTLNASPETKVAPETYDGETYVAPNGQHFRKAPDGIMREMVDELLSEREAKKGRRDDHDPGSPEYARYDRQQAAVKVIMNCFTPDTDVLTPDGVRAITDLEVGDPVYSLDPESMELEIKPVEATHAYPDYRGELVDFRTDKVDFRVTPNHRMLVRKNDRNGVTEDSWRFVEAGELFDYCNYELPHGWSMDHGAPLGRVDITEVIDGDYEVWVRPSVHGHTFRSELGWTPRRVPKADLGQTGYVLTAEEFEAHRDYVESVCERSYVHREPGRKWVPRTYDGDDFLRLLAWYVAEGNVYTSADRTFGEHFRGSSTTVKIAQNERVVADGGTDGHASIGDILDRMGLDYYRDERGYSFTSRLLGEFLRESCGAGSARKRIPDFVWDIDADGKRLFLETLIEGDGDWNGPTSWRYTTSSKRLRDDVLRLCAHLGLTASYNRDSGSWRIYCTEAGKNTLRPHRSAERSTATDGVYCVTVADNHTLLAGRNGTFQFVGQSLYGVSGWERFRLYDRESAAAVTATGREVIEFTAEAAAELDKEVIYGDTDSVMLELHQDLGSIEVDVDVPESMRAAHPEMDDGELREVAVAIDISFDIEDHINGRYDAFAREELNAEFHRFEIEFEKLYRRFLQAGKKKRYAGHIIWKEGNDVDDIDITGFEYKRSDIAPITKRVQREVIERIVRGEDLDDVIAYVREVIDAFEAGEVDLEEIAIPGGIGKRLDEYDTDTAQVRGAKYANLLLGTNFGRGSKPKRLYLAGVHPGFFEQFEADHPALFGSDNGGLADNSGLTADRRRQKALYQEFKTNQDVICFEYDDQLPEAFEVDYEKMLDRTVKGPIARILEALDVSWEEVRSGQEQTGLGQYM